MCPRSGNADGVASLREEQKQLTRSKLVAAARRLFAQRGYTAVRVDDLTAAAGCSRATFYLHFDSKVDVLRTLAAEETIPTATASIRQLERALESGGREEFRAWVANSIAWFQAHREWLATWDEASVLEPAFRELVRDGMLAMTDAMPTYLSRWPADRQDEARLRIVLLMSQMERFFTRLAQGTIDVSVERATEVLTDIWHPALTAPV